MKKIQLIDMLRDILVEYRHLEDCPIETVASSADFLVLKLTDDTIWRLQVSRSE